MLFSASAISATRVRVRVGLTLTLVAGVVDVADVADELNSTTVEHQQAIFSTFLLLAGEHVSNLICGLQSRRVVNSQKL